METSSAERTIRLIGAESFKQLEASHVLIVGIGGVGSYTAEALARAGVGEISLVDCDIVSKSNINRQLIALTSTVGQRKVDVMRNRILDINPQATVHTHYMKYCADTASCFDMGSYDFVVDAIDTVSSKVELIVCAVQSSTPIISAMGAGNNIDPSHFRVSDLSDTHNCPLARAVRKKLRKFGITSLPVVFSDEPKCEIRSDEPDDSENKSTENTESTENAEKTRHVSPGSISFVPSVMGLIIAGEAVRRLIQQ